MSDSTDSATQNGNTAPRYTVRNSLAPVGKSKPTFTFSHSKARSADGMITLDYSKDNPSNSGDEHKEVSFDCYHDGTTLVTASGMVDDDVAITAPGISRLGKEVGSVRPFSAIGDSVPAGIYEVKVTHSNITSHPAGNVSVLTGTLGPCPEIIIEPDENEEISCDACTCGGEPHHAGGTPESNARTLAGGSLSPIASSSGGSGVVRSANHRHMRFAFSFGSFRGMGDIPTGQLELTAFDYAATLLTPAALTFKHPFTAALVPQGERVAANEIFRVYDGAEYSNFIVTADGSHAFGVGASRRKAVRVHFVSALSKSTAAVCKLGDANAAYLRIARADGSATFFDLATNELVAFFSSDDANLSGQEKFSILREEDGSIRQIWNYWDGLADILPAEGEESGYTISLYLPNQVTAPAEEGAPFTTTGTPFKTFTIAGDAEAKSLTIRERDHSLPESMPDYITTWAHTSAGWNLTTGEGEDAICETREEVQGTPTNFRGIITTISQRGEVASCVKEIIAVGSDGENVIQRTEAYGTEDAQTSIFHYDRSGRQTHRIAPDGSEYKTVYDSSGRVTVQRAPWSGGHFHILSTIYRDDSGYSSEPALIEESVADADYRVHVIRTDTYTYSEENNIRRVEKRSTAAASDATQLTVEETWLATATNPYARGRVKMTQAANGVQHCHEYAPCSEYGALYTETIETRVNGDTVRSHSTRSIRYISAAGNLVRQEEWALLYDGTWAQTSGETYSYDSQNRLTGTTRDNGRSSTRTLTCTGQPLSEVDEDGIRRDYSYDAARRLVEVTRAAVMDGDTCITPETITEYTRDAVGRILCTKEYTGAMPTQHSTSYDLLGRPLSQCNTYGATTTYAYSEDGLTTTETLPTGATRITTRNADGSLARSYGTGQRELCYTYGVQDGTRSESITLADGTSIISQRLSNGFGETICEAAATTQGLVCTRYQYNDKGQRVRRQVDDGTSENALAPTLYSYDSFGNLVRETLALSDAPSASNSRLTIHTYSKVEEDDGVYSMVTTTHNNSAGGAYNSSTAELISSLSPTLEQKSIHTDPRGNISTRWVEYGSGPIRLQKQQSPTSSIIATTRLVDGFATSQTDSAGNTSSQSRIYGQGSMNILQTDGRGNTSIVQYDLLGRHNVTFDAAGGRTVIIYGAYMKQPDRIITPLQQGHFFRYDKQARKIAEFGSCTQPFTCEYDDAGNLTRLTTFRVNGEDITTDPRERTDGDSTCWVYDLASGLELSKTYADGSCTTKTYDSFGRLATETNARGIVKTCTYHSTTGELAAIVYSDGVTPAQVFTYTLTGKLASVTDAAGTRCFTYNEYDELVSDSLTVDEDTHLISENRDGFGRSTGFVYSKNGSLATHELYGYGSDGRLATAAFVRGGGREILEFGFSYLAGTNLLQTLTMPNGMSLTQYYEAQRDLITCMLYRRGETSVVERSYTYDAGRRPLTRFESRLGNSRSDSFTHNNRSELTAATIGDTSYSYTYDNIGNRKTAQENAEEATAYTANNLNQYTAVGNFVPEFDADGNQTRVQTSTGIWNVIYNAENRPVTFSRVNEDGSITLVTCAYDYMGRRTSKKEETITTDAETGMSSASTTLHQRYLYRGYLQIACCDLTRSARPHLWLITWDPTQPMATRPLAIQQYGTWYCYGWDLTKNICEVFNYAGRIDNTVTYSYTPYGAVTAEGSVTQPIQWSSEFYDEELGLVYYNYRHYNPADGRWLGRDRLPYLNLYRYTNNSSIHCYDVLGNYYYNLSDLYYMSSYAGASAKNEINNFADALSHYRSGAGGVVPAGQALFQEMRSHETYQTHVQSEDGSLPKRIIARFLREVREEETSGEFVSTPNTTVGQLKSLTLGSYGFNVKYSARWAATPWKKSLFHFLTNSCEREIIITAELELDLNEKWDFKENDSYSWWENLVYETGAEMIADMGSDNPATFVITGHFKDTIYLKIKQTK